MDNSQKNAENDQTEDVKRICDLVEERDKAIMENAIKIKWYKNAIETAERKISDVAKARKRLADESKETEKQCNQLLQISESTKQTQEICLRSLSDYQKYLSLFEKEKLLQKQEVQRIEKEATALYDEVESTLTNTDAYKQLHEAKVEFLKADIARRQLEVQIEDRKIMRAQQLAIDKKRYYNFFIALATEYVYQKKATELEELKKQELDAIKKLYLQQKEEQKREKMGGMKDKALPNMANIIFGSQEPTIKQTSKPVIAEPVIPKKQSHKIPDELFTLLQDPKPVEVPANKIQIIDQTIVIPTPEVPKFRVPEKRKSLVDMNKKWQKIRKSSSLIDKNVSWSSSQSSQLSQQATNEQLTTDIVNTQCPIENSPHEMPTETPAGELSIQEPLIEEGIAMNSDQHQFTPMVGGVPSQSPQPMADTKVKMPKPILSASQNKVNTGEQSKSVRFNLDENIQYKENKGTFGQSIFGNAFAGFFGQGPSSLPNENENMQVNDSFNVSSMMTNTREMPSSFYSSDGNEISPNFSYSDEAMSTSFVGGGTSNTESGGGFFSFNTKTMFPF